MTMHEHEFMRRLQFALGRHPRLRLWRQNVGRIPIPGTTRFFVAGPPKGAADLSGYVRPQGWRLEIEVKGDSTPLRSEQVTFARNIREAGCVYVLVRYDAALDPKANIARGVAEVERAIREREFSEIGVPVSAKAPLSMSEVNR